MSVLSLAVYSSTWVTGFGLANTPPPEFNPDTVTPGPAGFVAIAVVAVAVVLLTIDLTRRIRRNTYLAEIKARLEAEVAARKAAEAGAAATGAAATGAAEAARPERPGND